MDFSTVRDELSEEFGDVSAARMNKLILSVLRDLCLETWAYTEILAFLTTAGTHEYTLTPTVSYTNVIGIPDDGCYVGTVDCPVVSIADGPAGTLVAGTTYYYKVTSVSDDYGETVPSSAVSRAVPAAGELALSWSAIDGADSYNIYQSTDGTTYYYLSNTTGLTYGDDGTDTVTATTAPTKSQLVKAISLMNETRMSGGDRYWRSLESDDIQALVYDGKNVVRTDVIPETTGMFCQVETVLCPYSTSFNTIPSIFEPELEAINNGIRWKAYTDPTIAKNKSDGEYYRLLYEGRRNAIKGRKSRGFGGAKYVKIPFFA